MNIDNLKNHIEWEKYYNPNFDWNDLDFYRENICLEVFSDEFIKEFQDKINWGYLSTYSFLDDAFIEKHLDKLDKYWITISQKMGSKILKKIVSNYDTPYEIWRNISEHQILSEDFMREFQNDLDWEYLSFSQQFSDDFILEFHDKLNLQYILMFQKHLSKKCKREIMKMIRETNK